MEVLADLALACRDLTRVKEVFHSRWDLNANI